MWYLQDAVYTPSVSMHELQPWLPLPVFFYIIFNKVPYENKQEFFIMQDVSSVELYEQYEWKYPAH